MRKEGKRVSVHVNLGEREGDGSSAEHPLGTRNSTRAAAAPMRLLPCKSANPGRSRSNDPPFLSFPYQMPWLQGEQCSC
jgi:hypothetical protein